MVSLRRRTLLPLLLSLGLGAGPASAAVVIVTGSNGAPGIDGIFPGGSGTNGGAGLPAIAIAASIADGTNSAMAQGGNGGTCGHGADGDGVVYRRQRRRRRQGRPRARPARSPR